MRRRHREAKRLRGSQVYDEIEFRRLRIHAPNHLLELVGVPRPITIIRCGGRSLRLLHGAGDREFGHYPSGQAHIIAGTAGLNACLRLACDRRDIDERTW